MLSSCVQTVVEPDAAETVWCFNAYNETCAAKIRQAGFNAFGVQV